MEIAERTVRGGPGSGADAWTGFLAAPVRGGDIGVLVLAGSSGRIEDERCRLLAREGLTALSIRWFGGPGQPPGLCEVPLETFASAIRWLRTVGDARRIGVVGTSKGAEAALHLSAPRHGVDAVVAFSPASVSWANVGPGRDGRTRPQRSSWTWRGEPVPFVPYDDDWTAAEPDGGPVSVLGWYERSLRTFAARVPAAELPVGGAGTALVLVAGGDDLMWPSLRAARGLAARRTAAGLPVRLVTHDAAGHRVRVPGEGPAALSGRFRYGGSHAADAALGAAAWPHLLDALRGTGP
ncbi:acyl-CoA thioester hydrolase/BAAT C-terminal domain-containing protein [Streptomyces sp. NBC_01257]|uniref:acyl-CoA thioester hydrolase/BAAT C-terminal domain-containing protein n=1 Tax=Streptomyces sp. NBC_01257 TaxID=2903799 RepID=UPI002DD8F0C7|nr:acyl-CoA thioester hydrolase/BAAT C-terminal domain-containing protein [Streptomyces sp. NBC_01257]WRZ67958.1 acyl-CoA thioesterase [Streptomyces sp. NBC_01257]